MSSRPGFRGQQTVKGQSLCGVVPPPPTTPAFLDSRPQWICHSVCVLNSCCNLRAGRKGGGRERSHPPASTECLWASLGSWLWQKQGHTGPFHSFSECHIERGAGLLAARRLGRRASLWELEGLMTPGWRQGRWTRPLYTGKRVFLCHREKHKRCWGKTLTRQRSPSREILSPALPTESSLSFRIATEGTEGADVPWPTLGPETQEDCACHSSLWTLAQSKCLNRPCRFFFFVYRPCITNSDLCLFSLATSSGSGEGQVVNSPSLQRGGSKLWSGPHTTQRARCTALFSRRCSQRQQWPWESTPPGSEGKGWGGQLLPGGGPGVVRPPVDQPERTGRAWSPSHPHGLDESAPPTRGHERHSMLRLPGLLSVNWTTQDYLYRAV